MPLYEFLKLRFTRHLWSSSDTSLLSPPFLALCGSLAGGTAAFLTTPLDVIKTRVMLSLRRRGVDGRGDSWWEIGREVWKEGGIPGLWKGGGMRTLWIGLGGAIFLGIYDTVKGQMVSRSKRGVIDAI
jgi:solute carrier family 25 (mitochondrial S-adenosylmethionine transporter), member 26